MISWRAIGSGRLSKKTMCGLRLIQHWINSSRGSPRCLSSTVPLRLTVRKGEHRLSLTQLSDGERSFLALLGDMVRRLALANPDLENPLEGHGVVLIDELELHLHPTWQRQVVENLRTTFPNVQFIGTTHSPFVIQSLRPGELINLDPEEFGEYADKSIEDIAENIMGVALPQKSKRYLNMMGAAEQLLQPASLQRIIQRNPIRRGTSCGVNNAVQ